MNTNLFQYEASYGLARQLPAGTLPEFAFAGRSNVGKSSLLNCLLQRRQLARVSGTPGKTITINFFSDGNVRLVDLPGYGYAKRPQSELARFRALTDAYFAPGRPLELVFQLIDMRHAPTRDDEQMLRFLHARALPFVVVLTKADKLKPMARKVQQAQLEAQLANYAPRAIVAFSAQTREGRDALLAQLNCRTITEVAATARPQQQKTQGARTDD